MSVDSFIQSRVSVDTNGERPSPSPFLHTSLRNPEPAVDPRWDIAVQGAAAHEYLESIANELSETDRQVILASGPSSFSYQAQQQRQRSGMNRAVSDAEDDHGSTGSGRRTSILRTRFSKHGKNSSSANRVPQSSTMTASGGGPTYSQAGGSNSSSNLDARSGPSSTPYTSQSINSRRPAVSSAGTPTVPLPTPAHLPSSTPSTGILGTTAGGFTTGPSSSSTATIPGSLNRRANAPGPISVQRQRTQSLGGTGVSSSATNIPATAPPLRLVTDETFPLSEDSEYCIAVVGSKGCGKSSLLRKIIKTYPIVENTAFRIGDSNVKSVTIHVNVGKKLQSVRILEVDSALVAYPDNLWPSELPRVDGILLCYDASSEESFSRVPDLLAGYHSLGFALVVLACKSDLHKVVEPSRADACCKAYNIGLVEINVVNEHGKAKLRGAFGWEIKAISRHRRYGSLSSTHNRNPASPDILKGSKAPWDGHRIPSEPQTYTQPSSSSSSVGGTRHVDASTPTSVPPSVDAATTATASTASSTARTSMDSVMVGSSSQTPVSPSRQRSPSLPSSSSRARSTSDLLSEARGMRARDAALAAVAASSTTHDSTVPRTASTSSIQQGPTQTAATPSVSAGPATTEANRNPRESYSLQWATLDDILDKLLFVAVSGDDPVFIQHFFLTYRRFASPRSVLLGMQKRMRQLSQETKDPLLAKFAQMRICSLLSQWKDHYPTDFGAPGTFGALAALLKQIVSNVHLAHYASDLLPFLDEVPKLVDREASWSKKETVEEDSEEEGFNASDDEIIPILDDPDDIYVGKGKAFERRTPVSSNPPPPPQQASTQRPYQPKASSSAPNVATIPAPPVPSVGTNRALSSTGHGQDAGESVITFDRQVNSKTRVNVKELQRIATSILTMETVHLAQEITRRMWLLFKRVEARDWLRRTLSGKGYDKENDAIGQLGRMFNYLCCWVSAMIVAFDRPQARARVVDKMIIVAKALRQLNNYMGMKAFVTGINNVRGNDDEELTQIIASKPNSNWKQFQSLHVLLGSARMGHTYRTALKHTVGPAIPDLERHGSDLLRTNEANLDFDPEDPNRIHWGKFTIIGKLVATVTLYQNRCHAMPDYRDLEARPHITDLIFNQVVWDYDTLMSREARALEEAQTTESSLNIKKLFFKG